MVQQYGWLNDKQFLDAVAVAMLSRADRHHRGLHRLPGASFRGRWRRHRCVPACICLSIPFPWFDHLPCRLGSNRGGVLVLARRAITDVPTLLIALVALGIVWRFKVPEPVLIAAPPLAC